MSEQLDRVNRKFFNKTPPSDRLDFLWRALSEISDRKIPLHGVDKDFNFIPWLEENLKNAQHAGTLNEEDRLEAMKIFAPKIQKALNQPALSELKILIGKKRRLLI